MNTQQNTYTFHINTPRLDNSYKVDYKIEAISAESIEDAFDKCWNLHIYKDFTLKSINGLPYVYEEDSAESASKWADSEERYWSAVTTCSERFCDHSDMD